MTKKNTGQQRTAAAGMAKKVLRKLEQAQSKRKDAERKVGTLRARLEAAEAKLSKRTLRVDTLQGRMQSTSRSADTPTASEAQSDHAVGEDLQLAPLEAKTTANGDHGARTHRRRTRGK